MRNRQALVRAAVVVAGVVGLGSGGGGVVRGVASSAGVSAPPWWSVHVGKNPVAVAVDSRWGRAFVVQQGDLDPYNNPVGSGRVDVIDLRSEKLLPAVTVGMSPVAVAVDERSGHAFVANYGESSVTTLDVRHGTVLGVVAVGPGPRVMATDGRGGRVLVANEGVTDSMGSPIGRGSVSVLDGQSGTVVRTIAVDASPMAVAVDEQSGHAALLTAHGGLRVGAVSVLDIGSGRVLATIASGPYPTAMALDQRNGHVFVTTKAPSPAPAQW